MSTPEKQAARNKALQKEEAAKIVLEAQTIDQVALEEQQPESDHHYPGEKTEYGVFRDRHWRNASRWFSYNLKDPDRKARTLPLTYFG